MLCSLSTPTWRTDDPRASAKSVDAEVGDGDDEDDRGGSSRLMDAGVS